MVENNSPSKDDKTPHKKWRKRLLIALFVLLNVVVIALAGFSEFGNAENAAQLADVKINTWLLLPAIGFFVVAVVLDIYKYVLMMRKLDTSGGAGHRRKKRDFWKVARRTVLLGRYYDNITPAAVGGQPFQMVYMRKNSGLSKGASTSIPVCGMISGKWIKRCKDKTSMYKKLIPITIPVMIITEGRAILLKNSLLDSFTEYFYMTLIDVIFLLGLFIFWSGVLFLLHEKFPKIRIILLQRMSKGINSIFCIHWVIIAPPTKPCRQYLLKIKFLCVFLLTIQ